MINKNGEILYFKAINEDNKDIETLMGNTSQTTSNVINLHEGQLMVLYESIIEKFKIKKFKSGASISEIEEYKEFLNLYENFLKQYGVKNGSLVSSYYYHLRNMFLEGEIINSKPEEFNDTGEIESFFKNIIEYIILFPNFSVFDILNNKQIEYLEYLTDGKTPDLIRKIKKYPCDDDIKNDPTQVLLAIHQFFDKEIQPLLTEKITIEND